MARIMRKKIYKVSHPSPQDEVPPHKEKAPPPKQKTLLPKTLFSPMHVLAPIGSQTCDNAQVESEQMKQASPPTQVGSQENEENPNFESQGRLQQQNLNIPMAKNSGLYSQSQVSGPFS